MFSPEMLNEFLTATGETLYMVILATLFSYIIGLPIGILLVITDKGGIRPIPVFNAILGIIVNILRSIPFAILIFAISPLTRAVVGTTLGSTATIVPLVIGAAPFVARMVESSLKEVDGGVIEAAQAMGASAWQITYKVLVPEAKPSLIIGSAITFATIIGYSAMAGYIGGGGLGTVAVNYGYYRYDQNVMIVTVAIMVIIVQLFQELGMRIAKRFDRRKH